MKIVKVRTPSGSIINVQGPDDASDAEFLQQGQLLYERDYKPIEDAQRANFPTKAEGGNPDEPWFTKWVRQGVENLPHVLRESLNPALAHPMDTLNSIRQTPPMGSSVEDMAANTKLGVMPLPAPETLGASLMSGMPGRVVTASPTLPVNTNAWNYAKGTRPGQAVARAFTPTPGTPEIPLDAPAVNKWMNVARREVEHGTDPGQQILDEHLLGPTKEATKANVDAALKDAGQQMDKLLKAGDAQGVEINAKVLIKDAFRQAENKLKANTSDVTFPQRLSTIFRRIGERYPKLANLPPGDKLSATDAGALKTEIGKNIDWRLTADDPVNDALIQVYRDLNTAIKGQVDGIADVQRRWGNLSSASDNLRDSINQDIVGKGSGPASPQAVPAGPPGPSPAWNAAKKLAPYAIKHAIGGSALYGGYKLARDLLEPPTP